jgi:hypothetical protein
MYRLTIVLIAFALPAAAADFRAVDIGESCNNVDAWEMARSSTRNLTHADPPLDVYSYNVEEFGRRVTVRYLCHSGKFISGHYDFSTETWTQAVATYSDIYKSLRSTYGAPSTDDHPTGDIDNKARSSNHWTTHIAAWEKSTSSMVLIIAPKQPAKPEQDEWHVVIDVHGHATRLDDLTIG